MSLFNANHSGVANRAVTIIPADSDLAVEIRGLYVGVTGNVRVTTSGGDDSIFVAVPAGSILPIACKRVWLTSTTAGSILGLI